MNIFILSIVSLLLAIGVWIYLHIISIDKENKTFNGFIVAVKAGRAVNIYSMIVLIVLLVLGIELELVYKNNLLTWNIKMLVLTGLIFPAAFIDYKEHIIPNKIIIIGILLRIVIWLVEVFNNPEKFFAIFKGDIIACVMIVAFFFICSLIVKNGIGMGDVKLMGMMALYQGLTGIMSSLFFSMLVAFFEALVLLITHKKNRKDTIAFAPAVLAGTIAAVAMTGL